MEIICHFITCFVIAKGTQQCGRVQTGTKEDLSAFVLKMEATPGDMLTAECVKKGERFQIDWSKK